MTAWAQLEQELTAMLAELPEGAFVLVSAPKVPGRDVVVRRRALFGLLTERREPTQAFTQFLRLGDILYGECAGPADQGGPFAWTPDEQEQIQSLGWARSQDTTFAHPNYELEWPATAGAGPAPAELQAAAAVGLRTLREVLHCDPDDIQLTATTRDS